MSGSYEVHQQLVPIPVPAINTKKRAMLAKTKYCIFLNILFTSSVNISYQWYLATSIRMAELATLLQMNPTKQQIHKLKATTLLIIKESNTSR